MKKRFYSLFEKQDGKWHRIVNTAYTKDRAVLIYQDKLLEPFFSGGNKRELRPLTEKQLEEIREIRCRELGI